MVFSPFAPSENLSAGLPGFTRPNPDEGNASEAAKKSLDDSDYGRAERSAALIAAS
jgi:hypothetical protein